MTSTIERLRTEDRKAMENADRDYLSAVKMESNGGTPDVTALRKAMTVLGKTTIDYAADLARVTAAKEDRFLIERGEMAAAELPAIRKAQEANRLRLETVKKECAEEAELLDSQALSLSQSIDEGKAAMQRRSDDGTPESKENLRRFKELEMGFARAFASVDADLQIVVEELRLAGIRVGNVERGTAEGDIAALRAAKRDLEAKKTDVQKRVDQAKTAYESARQQTARARQLVIES